MTLDWLRNDWFVMLVIALGSVTMIMISQSTYAASSQPDIPPCEEINTAGGITIYRCEPDDGPPYKINSLGFMLNESD